MYSCGMKTQNQIKRKLSEPTSIEYICGLIESKEIPHRSALAAVVCEQVGFYDARGQAQRAGRYREGGQDGRMGPRRVPGNKLSEKEEQEVLKIANSTEYKESSPKQIVPRLADQGQYVASESSFYRILRKQGQLSHRESSRPASRNKPEEFVATGPNQVYTWDITYLRMKGSTLLATLQRLGIVASFSRPRVSDDNPYSEALFRTLKYRPEYPRRPFETIEEARQWVRWFVRWYNTEHLHSAIRFVTPDDRHFGTARCGTGSAGQQDEGFADQLRSAWAPEQKLFRMEQGGGGTMRLQPLGTSR